MRKVRATIRPRPQIIVPNEDKLETIWNWAKRNYVLYLSAFDRFLLLFCPYKELVHPKDFRIFRCKLLHNKVVKIGRFVNNEFDEVCSFEELEKLGALRYLK